jgi:hypothetical protein
MNRRAFAFFQQREVGRPVAVKIALGDDFFEIADAVGEFHEWVLSLILRFSSQSGPGIEIPG